MLQLKQIVNFVIFNFLRRFSFKNFTFSPGSEMLVIEVEKQIKLVNS